MTPFTFKIITSHPQKVCYPKIYLKPFTLKESPHLRLRECADCVWGFFLIYWPHFGHCKTWHPCSSGVGWPPFTNTKRFSFPSYLCFWMKFATRRNSLTSMDSQVAATKAGWKDTSVCWLARKPLQTLSHPSTFQKLPRVAQHTKKTGRCP